MSTSRCARVNSHRFLRRICCVVLVCDQTLVNAVLWFEPHIWICMHAQCLRSRIMHGGHDCKQQFNIAVDAKLQMHCSCALAFQKANFSVRYDIAGGRKGASAGNIELTVSNGSLFVKPAAQLQCIGCTSGQLCLEPHNKMHIECVELTLTYSHIQGFWLACGPEPLPGEGGPSVDGYILTPSIRGHLRAAARAASLGRFPVLVQGPTSSGKTSMVEHLAKVTGHACVRINNHEHTDLQARWPLAGCCSSHSACHIVLRGFCLEPLSGPVRHTRNLSDLCLLSVLSDHGNRECFGSVLGQGCQAKASLPALHARPGNHCALLRAGVPRLVRRRRERPSRVPRGRARARRARRRLGHPRRAQPGGHRSARGAEPAARRQPGAVRAGAGGGDRAA
jgi:hypothetical protein